MLTNIVKATRAHYAALQHKPDGFRVALDYEVAGHTHGTVWVRVHHKAMRKANITRLINRLQDMYPEARYVMANYRQT